MTTIKKKTNYYRTKRAVNGLLGAQDVRQWMRRLVNVATINYGLKTAKDPKTLELISKISAEVRNMGNSAGYYVFSIAVSPDQYSGDDNEDTAFLLCTYARIRKTTSFHSWIVLAAPTLEELHKEIEENYKEIVKETVTPIMQAYHYTNPKTP